MGVPELEGFGCNLLQFGIVGPDGCGLFNRFLKGGFVPRDCGVAGSRKMETRGVPGRIDEGSRFGCFEISGGLLEAVGAVEQFECR